MPASREYYHQRYRCQQHQYANPSTRIHAINRLVLAIQIRMLAPQRIPLEGKSHIYHYPPAPLLCQGDYHLRFAVVVTRNSVSIFHYTAWSSCRCLSPCMGNLSGYFYLI